MQFSPQMHHILQQIFLPLPPSTHVFPNNEFSTIASDYSLPEVFGCNQMVAYVCHMLCLYPSGSLLCLLLFPLPKIVYLSSASLQFLLILNPVQNCSFITTLYRTILDWTHNLPFPTFFKSINYILSLFDKYTVPYFVDC